MTDAEFTRTSAYIVFGAETVNTFDTTIGLARITPSVAQQKPYIS